MACFQSRRSLVAVSTALLLALGAAPAFGLEPGKEEADKEASTALFREGRALVNQGKLAEACAKFRESLALRRSGGTLLNVANCSQSEGDLLGALAAFEETLSLAASEPDERRARAWTSAAREGMVALDPRVPRLTVQPPNASDPSALSATAPSIRVLIDGQPIPMGEPVRVNPGAHRVEAMAEGRQPFSRSLELAEGQTETVQLPELAPLVDSTEPAVVPVAPNSTVASPAVSAAPALSPAEPEPATRPITSDEPGREPSSVVPWTIFAVGGAVFVGGAITGLVAAQMESDLKATCPKKSCENDLSPRDRVAHTALAADILMAVGLVGVGVGGTWLLTSDEPSSARVSASCGVGSCGATLSGRF